MIALKRLSIASIWLNHKGEPNRDNLPVHQISDMSELEEVVKGLEGKYRN